MFEILQKLVEKYGAKKVVEVGCMILNSSVMAFEDAETETETETETEIAPPRKKAVRKKANKKTDLPEPPVDQSMSEPQPTATFPDFITECTTRRMSMDDIDAHCVKMVGVKLAEILPNGLETKIPLLIRSLPDVA